jgi:MFS family permease
MSLASGFSTWVEPWYLAYALQGVVVAGVIPIALPLAAGGGGNVALVGLVMAAFSLGGLTAPLWGALADRHRLHRSLLSGGLLVLGAALALFALLDTPAIRLGLALTLGIAAAASATVANLFVVEAHPESEWDERIGWLQTFYGGGQVVGLLLAGLLSVSHPGAAFAAAALLALLAAAQGWFATETPAFPLSRAPVLLHPVRSFDASLMSPQRLFHHPDAHAVAALGTAMRSAFGGFVVLWLVSFGGAAAVFSLYPVLMERGFGVMPDRSSAAFALSATLGLLLYSPAGRWAERLGSLRVLQTGLVVRLVAFAALAALGWSSGLAGREWLAMGCVVLIVLAWSPLSVSGTAMAAELSPVGKGAGLGLFNAATAVAGVLGAVAGGWVASRWGYSATAALALAGVTFGLVWSFAARPLATDSRA